jgi:hypothetical protein
MTTNNTSRKGQMSFDLGFAIILMLLVLGMIAGYWEDTVSSTRVPRARFARNTLENYVVNNLNAFYTSLLGGGTGNYSMSLSDEFLFNDLPDVDDNPYEVDYTVQLSYSNLTLSIGPDNIRIVQLGFDTGCTINADRGQSILFKNCEESGGNLGCECTII